MSVPLVEVRGVTKRHGHARALRGVDLRLEPGERVALLGANGAGKTTLLRLLAGLTRATTGEVLADGAPAFADPVAWRARLGHVSHQLLLHDALTARENLLFACRMHGVAHPRSRIDQLLRSLDVHERADEPVRQLSRGLVQRVAVARALVHDPEILLLDEPFTGLDARAEASLALLLDAMIRRGRTIVLATHDLARVAGGAGRAVVLRAGKVVAELRASDVAADDLAAHVEGRAGAATAT